MSRRPICAAAPSPLSKSPAPQSQHAFTNAGCSARSSLMQPKSPWAVTNEALDDGRFDRIGCALLMSSILPQLFFALLCASLREEFQRCHAKTQKAALVPYLP